MSLLSHPHPAELRAQHAARRPAYRVYRYDDRDDTLGRCIAVYPDPLDLGDAVDDAARRHREEVETLGYPPALERLPLDEEPRYRVIDAGGNLRWGPYFGR